MQNYKSGKYVNQGFHKAFIPEKINRDWELSDMSIINMLSIADRNLGRLDMFSEYVNIDLFISMHIAKEATQSSRIEGTQTNIEESFMKRSDIATEKRNDWEEVQNYILAMHEAIKQLDILPFSSRLIKNTHKILLQGVRGKNKQPGEFRKSQNWIGGASLSDAIFIPPPHNQIPSLISDLEIFANDNTNQIPDLIKIALIHYQFETIHPFLDGNGRVGRLMITLYLVNKGILKRPILYLSDFLERNRNLYYENLNRVRTNDDIAQWLKFFLVGVAETSNKGVETFNKILQLQKSVELRISDFGIRISDARIIIQALFNNPITDAYAVSKLINKSNVSAYKIIADLERLNILKEITGSQRGRIYSFHEYLDIFRS